MATTVTLASAKGGASKSTLCIEIVMIAQARGVKAIAIDTDPQGTVSRFARQHGMDDFVVSSDFLSPAKLKKLRQDYDLIVIDTPGAAAKEVDQVLRVADLILVPIKTSAADLWSNQVLLTHLKDEGLGDRTRIIIAQSVRNTRLTREVREALNPTGIQVMYQRMPNLVGHMELIRDGELTGLALSDALDIYQELVDTDLVPAGTKTRKKV